MLRRIEGGFNKKKTVKVLQLQNKILVRSEMVYFDEY